MSNLKTWQKRCGRCGRTKALSDFHRRGTIHQAWCKTCRREYDAADRHRTRQVRIAQKQRYRPSLSEWYRSLKTGKPCADCGGVFHYSAMEWDHRPGVTKRVMVSSLIGKSNSERAVLAEIAKCDLVCANCHAVRTFNRAAGRSSAW
jgi:hypothetical protein